MDVSQIKAEIKAWERAFKSSNLRDPTIQDIKLQPKIADKYKLYKKLSKATNNHPPTQASLDPPSTPPRIQSSGSQPLPSLFTKPRIAETTAPLTSFNPFSPQKNKGKQKEVSVIPIQSPPSAFSSSFKSKPKGSPVSNPFPLLAQPRPSSSSLTPTQSSPPATSALSRARKRLRGEPVSPSPNKGKRRRVGSQTTLPFKKLALDSSSSEDFEDNDVNSFFVVDSPVKAPAGRKSFRLLFEESATPGPSNGKSSSMRVKNIPVTELFEEKSTTALDSLEEKTKWNTITTEQSNKSKVNIFQSSVTPLENPGSSSTANNGLHVVPDSLEITKPTKRPLTDMESVTINVTLEPLIAGPSLLPPSPPPAKPLVHTSQRFSNTKNNAQTRPIGRKKVKTTNEYDKSDDEDDQGDVSNITIKVIDRAQVRPHHPLSADAEKREDLDYDLDPIIGYARRAAPHGQETDLPPGVELEGKFEVNLPNELRRMLALEPVESQARDSREEQVVKGLVFGRRTNRYDPVKGGEIWDVGEDDTRHDGDEEMRKHTEEDWEAEPIPWEVGEL